MRLPTIKFGTSGWRAVLCEDFTFDNVGIVTRAIAEHLKETGLSNSTVLVGFDNRFMGDRFAKAASLVLAAHGIKAALTNRSTPTPVISFDILKNARGGGINFTASHNPPEYNGLKFSPDWGGPALPETTQAIERLANSLLKEGQYSKMDFDEAVKKGLVTVHDPMPDYLERIEELVDLNAIGRAGLKIAMDPLYGTSVGYLDHLLKLAGADVTVLHGNPDPTFGGRPPEPSEENIPELIDILKNDPSTDLGLSTDGDADRYGLVDRGGRFMEPNYFLALLFDYLVRERGIEGGAARSVATTHLVDAVASDLGRELYETPVGFKFIGDLLRQGKLAVGGEESAGLTIRGHVPEKDGILACLLAAEMVARRGKTLFTQLDELYSRVGVYVTKRVNFHLTPAEEARFPEKLAVPPKVVDGSSVKDIVTIDGVKLILEDGRWLLVRKSGTEPVVRLYVEASRPDGMEGLIAEGRKWLLG